MDNGGSAQRTRTIVLAITATAIFGALAVTLARAAVVFPLNTDAGYWVSRARMVARGMVPFVDFHTPYAPGPYYLFALFGEGGLASPTLVKSLVYAAEALSAFVLAAILLRRGTSRAAAALAASVFLAWVVAADGLYVILEPFQTLACLAALWLVSKPCGLRTVALAGLIAGAALMVKQYSLVYVPALALAVAASRPDGAAPAWKRLAVFAAAIPVAFLAFAVVTGQDPVHALGLLTTWGGVRYAPDGLRAMVGGLAFGRVTRPIGAALVLGAVLLVRRRDLHAASLVTGLACAAMPLYVRNYQHYAQLAAPFAVLIAMELLRDVDTQAIRWSARAVACAALVVLAVAFELAPIASSVVASHGTMTRTPIDDQLRIARRIEQELASREDVLVVNFDWLYALSDIEQPLPQKELRYSDGLHTVDGPRDASRTAVLGPGRQDFAEARAWLEEGGFRLRATIDADLPVLLFTRPAK